MKRKKSHTVALCGIFGALALTVMLLGNLLPLATYLSPMLAGLLVLPVVCEAGRGTGWLFYTGIALLSLLLLADKEAAILFCAFLGYYPLAKFSLEKLPRPLRILLKAALFNTAVIAAYRLMLHLFGMAALQQEFAAMTGGWLAALLVLANVTFWMYDLAVARVFALYIRVLRPRIQKALH